MKTPPKSPDVSLPNLSHPHTSRLMKPERSQFGRQLDRTTPGKRPRKVFGGSICKTPGREEGGIEKNEGRRSVGVHPTYLVFVFVREREGGRGEAKKGEG